MLCYNGFGVFYSLILPGLAEKGDNSSANYTPTSPTHHGDPSLAKIILNLENNQNKEQAVNHILKALSISYAR